MRIFYDVIEANRIFGMVGRCGGGYNTLWEDWSPKGINDRDKIMKEYEDGLNKICGHYEKLEESVLKEGFRNPLIVTRGYPVIRDLANLPLDLYIRGPGSLLLLEGVTGGSRLWVAQKHNLKVPCIINDFVGNYTTGVKVYNVEDAKRYFKDIPKTLKITLRSGLTEIYDSTKVCYHLNIDKTEDELNALKVPLWINTMNKYGYIVHNLPPYTQNILDRAGIVQKSNLKKIFVDK